MNYRTTLKTSLQTAWIIIKLIIPIYIFAEVLYYYNILSYISFIIEPIALLLELPKETTLALLSGMFLNLYAAIAFAAPLDLTAKEWTVLAVFLGICHSLIVESAVMKRIGLSLVYSYVLRIIAGFVVAFLVTLIPDSYFNVASKAEVEITTYSSLWDVLVTSSINASVLTFQIILLITAIIFLMDFIKNLSFIKNSQKNVSKGFTLSVGVILGITYGAGVLIKEAQGESLSKEDVFYIGTFLMICHAIIEDTLLFVIFNANLTVIVVVRFIAAFVIAWGLLYWYKKSPLFHRVT